MINKSIAFILPLLFSAIVNADCGEQAETLFNKGLTHKKEQHFKQALTDLQQSAQLCSNFQVSFALGKTLLKLERYDDALDHFKQARNISEKNSKYEASALANIALTYFYKENLLEASTWIEQAYQVKPSKWIIKLRKTIGLQQAGHIVKANEIRRSFDSTKSFGVTAKVSLNSITFKFDSAILTTQGMQQVTELEKSLSSSNKKRVKLIGHTDKIGGAEYNRDLSLRRAEAVKKALVAKNTALKDTVETQGKGESELKYLGDTETDHQLNRRVDIELL